MDPLSEGGNTLARVVLSDGTIRAEIEAGRIVIEPFEAGLIQPSSVDVRVDRKFRVFHNNRYPYIDVRKENEHLTELVEVEGDEPFILHPGEFVLGQTLERGTDLLVRDLKRLTRANMAEEIDRFVQALDADGIQPMDF